MPSLTPEAAASLRAKLLLYRKRLLDLSLRNRLLSWKPSKRFTIDLREVELSDAYRDLVEEEGGSLDLVPDYDEETYREAGRRVPSALAFLQGYQRKTSRINASEPGGRVTLLNGIAASTTST